MHLKSHTNHLIVLFFLAVVSTLNSDDMFAQESSEKGLVLRRLPNLTQARKDLTTGKNILSGVLINRSEADKESLILSYYETDSKKQFGRRIWVPANSEMSFFFSMGPLSKAEDNKSVDIQSILYDTTGGKKEVIKTKEGRAFYSSKFRTSFKRKRLALIGHSPEEISVPLPRYKTLQAPLSDFELFTKLIRFMQRSRNLSYETVSSGILPATEDAYNSLEYLVIAGDQITYDAAGCKALRNWLENDGGKLWIFVDRVSESTISSLLGETILMQEVERTQINNIKFETGMANTEKNIEKMYSHEKPIDFVKVITDPEDVIYKVNGWPAAFMKNIGKGSILFTALGSRGWTRKLNKNEPNPNGKNNDLSIPTDALKTLNFLWSESVDDNSFEVATLKKTLEEKIGHSILPRSKVIMILGSFCGSLLVIGVFLKLLKKTSYFGLIGPVVSVGISGFLINLGSSSQHSVPATIATYQFATSIEETNDLAMSGLMSIYYPKTYQEKIGINRGGRFQFDQLSKVDGQKLIQTDLDSWIFEDLSMPAGSVQTTSFERVQSLSEPLVAKGIFGPEGLALKIDSEMFSQFEDSLIITPQARMLRAEASAGGKFKASPEFVLQDKVYIPSSGIMTTSQQRHDKIYSEYLTKPISKDEPDTKVKGVPKALQGKDMLLTWTTPVDTNFELQENAKIVGDLLVALPIMYQKTAPGTVVSIPAPLISYKSVQSENKDQVKSTAYSNQSRGWNSISTRAETLLRFQLPESVLPMEIEKIKLKFQIQAPTRELKIEGFRNGQKETLHTINSPNGVYTHEISQKEILDLDDKGGLLLVINIGSSVQDNDTQTKLNWKIEFLELEAFGTTQK
jgi:hypothetical protein